MESTNFNFSSLIVLIRVYWKVFLIVGIIAVIVGVVISMPAIMPPKFKSTAVVYPANIETYSDESETEQLLQFFESSSIRDSLTVKFDLYKRYDIDPEAQSARYYLIQEYNDHVVSSKTQYESVRLEVTDEDPVIAKEMADEVLRQVNLKFNRVINDWGMERANSYKDQMDYQRSVIDSIEAMTAQLSVDNRLLDYGSQSRELMRGYLQYGGSGKNSPIFQDIEEWMKGAQESGSLVRMLQNLSYFATFQHDLLNKEYLFWRERANRNIDYLQVIISPEVTDKKVWPVRWVILLVSVVSAMLFTAVILALIHGTKKA